MDTTQKIHSLAEELNDVLSGCAAGKFLSALGKRIYFPKGIIAQSAEAKKSAKNANATIGTAVQNGQPLMLSSLKKYLPDLSPSEAVGYAPTAGNPALREMWRKFILKKNPSLSGVPMSMPVLVPGLTAGISILSDLFVDHTTPVLTADPYWENYALIIEARRNATIHTFNMFEDGAFSVENFKKAVLKEAETGRVRLLLNFPQNPAGYTPVKREMDEIAGILVDAAQKADIMVWCDDAYFGLNYEDDICDESLFTKLAAAHEKILAVKIDGPTKEDYAWGLRTGFVTFASKGMTDGQYDALVKKLMGLIRSSVSCAATESQSIILKAFDDPSTEEEKQTFKEILNERYQLVKKSVRKHSGSAVIQPLPFNSGYFMCLRCTGIHAEDLRQRLLNTRGIGTVAIDEAHLRVAFSSVDAAKIESVYDAIYETAEEMAAGK